MINSSSDWCGWSIIGGRLSCWLNEEMSGTVNRRVSGSLIDFE